MKRYSDYLREGKVAPPPATPPVQAPTKVSVGPEQQYLITTNMLTILNHVGEAWAMKARGMEVDAEEHWKHARDFTDTLGNLLEELGYKKPPTWDRYLIAKKYVEERALPGWITPELSLIVSDILIG